MGLEQRTAPSARVSFSAITFAVDPPPDLESPAGREVLKAVGRARAAGVTTFDLRRARYPAAAERAIPRAAQPAEGKTVVWLSRGGTTSSPRSSGEPIPHDGRDLASSIAASLARLGPSVDVLVEWRSTAPRSSGFDPLPEPLAHLESSGRIAGTIRPCRRPEDLPYDGPPTALASGALSLLDRDLLESILSRASPPSFGFIAEDVYAGGRLDGSSMGGPQLLGPPSRPPVPISGLQASFAPVLRLGFLTQQGDRTLAQAAVRFALTWPWVLSVPLPLPPAGQVESVLRSASIRPIDAAELTRLGVGSRDGVEHLAPTRARREIR